MYKGEVDVHHNQIPNIVKAAESLQIKGLGGNGESRRDTNDDDDRQRDEQIVRNLTDYHEEEDEQINRNWS